MSQRTGLETQAAASARSRLTPRLDEAIENAASFLLDQQHADGYWLDEPRVAKLAQYVRRRQLSDGGWNIFAGGPSEVNATVKAYFALKLAGDDPRSERMLAACHRVRELGGLEKTNSFVRLYLALGGIVGWEM